MDERDLLKREIWRLIRDDMSRGVPLADLTSYAAAAPKSYGTVRSFADGIARADGLDDCMNGELIRFEDDVFGMAMNLEEEEVGIVVLSTRAVKAGTGCVATGHTLQMPTGPSVLSRVLNPLGRTLDGGEHLPAEIPLMPLEADAPSIPMREAVNVPLETGMTAIDALIPIGRGQRELIIGDRQTGKTTIALDTIIHQKGRDVICVYVSIGQKMADLARIHALLRDEGALDYTVVVAASAAESPGIRYLAPYAGCALAEGFVKEGKDCLIVYDDLTKHAQAYRAISLLLRRPPGREAFPGDIFYVHARLLERAAKLDAAHGGGSMTALPIVETQAGDISAYIPTNIISITDGQIYLEPDLFFAGQRPAVNVGLSVSRVGGDAQSAGMRQIAGALRIGLAQYREKRAFAQFGSDLDEATRQQLDTGDKLMRVLRQGPREARTAGESVILLCLGAKRAFSDVASDQLETLLCRYLIWLRSRAYPFKSSVAKGQKLTEDEQTAIVQSWHDFMNADQAEARRS